MDRFSFSSILLVADTIIFILSGNTPESVDFSQSSSDLKFNGPLILVNITFCFIHIFEVEIPGYESGNTAFRIQDVFPEWKSPKFS